MTGLLIINNINKHVMHLRYYGIMCGTGNVHFVI